jgi:chemotaxis protein MotB
MNTRQLAIKGVLAAGLLGLGLVSGGCNNNLKEENAALNQENVQLREQNGQLQSSLGAAQSQVASMQSELDRAKTVAQPPAGSGDGGNTGWNGGGGGADVVITVAGDVLFDSGKAELKRTARTELDRVASTIKNRHSGHRVRVEGYTDSDPIRKSKWGSNEALSQARADAVAEYLRSKGVRSVTSEGMGSANPKATKAASRRVEIVIVGNG